MLVLGELEKCKRYIESHSAAIYERGRTLVRLRRGPCITISRETGTGARRVSEALVKYLQKYHIEDSPGWTIFDKNLIQKVLEDHQLPARLSSLMEEDKISFFSSILNEMFSGQPDIWSLIHKTSKTIMQIGSLGYAIIIGRAGNVITSKFPNTFHVRLIAPYETRVRWFAEDYHLDFHEAKRIVDEHDNSRRKFLHSVFMKKIDDPLLYDLIINTVDLNHVQIAKIIGSAVLRKFPNMFNKVKNNRIVSI
jgi:cytidylate kinase